MTPFLKLVAEDLKRKNADGLARSVAVFPNRRASLFLDEYLAGDTPCWSPRYMTISELFRTLTPLRPADPIDTACRIFSIYCDLCRDEAPGASEETLDGFYGWAERLLTDFEDIDKCLAPADDLLRNVTAWREINLGKEVEDEVREQIRRFFGTLDGAADDALKERFVRLWNHLLPLYERLNAELRAEGLAYEGALQRDAVEALEQGRRTLPDDVDTYYFIGFNALEEVERRLFRWLQAEGKAKFYWDYDLFYTAEAARNEAGAFIRDNISRFGSELPPSCFDAFRPERIEIVAAPTESAQAYYAAQWLEDNLTPEPRETAVVLCNEDLLEPILHALPPAVRQVNITKGFPLAHTAAYTLVSDFFARKASADVPLAEVLTALAEKLAEKGRENNAACLAAQAAAQQGEPAPDAAQRMMLEIHNEAYFQAYTLANRFLSFCGRPHFTPSASTAGRLLLQVMRQTSIPFHGEPAEGLQVMGVLETRCLDFRRLLLLSVNEGTMPRPARNNSFIPYPLRAAFGLSDASRQTAVFAYYFYRLVQRAERVTFLYNNTPDGLHTGERSRFLLQLMLQPRLKIEHRVLAMSQKPFSFAPQAAQKPRDLFDLLNPLRADAAGDDTRRKALSPSSLNLFIDCPLRFYFHRVAHLKTPDKPDAPIDAKTFGNVFHTAAQIYYKDCHDAGVENYAAHNGRVLAEKDRHTLLACIERAFRELKMPQGDAVVRDTVLQYLISLLRYDVRCPELRIEEVETDAYITLKANCDGTQRDFRVGGRIDRLDVCAPPTDLPGENAQMLRIVDYKTGSHEQYAKSVDDIFDPENKERPSYFFQTYLYALTQQERARSRDLPLGAALFYPHKSTRPGYDPWIGMPCSKPASNGKLAPRTHILSEDVLAEFRRRLQDLLDDLFDLSKPFEPRPTEQNCRYCDFRVLCGLPPAT